jgi:heme/copper-type cytochrome/quinol oxidase subunit 2
VSPAYLVTLLAAAIVVVVEAVLLVDWLQRRGAAPVGAVRERSNLALDLLWLLAPLALLTVLVVLTVRAAAGAEGLGLGVAGGS